MSRLIKLSSVAEQPIGSVVFVHGLGGHAYDTWRFDEASTLWPVWLSEDAGLDVYSLSYHAPTTNWLGGSMALADRARNIAEALLSAKGLASGQVAFVCHSLGGLLIKQAILDLNVQRKSRPEAASLLDRIR